MALASAAFIADLIVAFKATDWAVCGTLLGAAFDDFIQSGIINTSVTATVTPPPPAVPYPVAGGLGVGPITTSGVSTLQAAISAKLVSPVTVWADLGAAIAAAVDVDVKTGTTTTTVTGPLTGTGVGAPACIDTTTTLAVFISSMTAAFLPPNIVWEVVAEKVASATTSYLTGAIVTTTDSGPVPPVWAGSGTGSIS